MNYLHWDTPSLPPQPPTGVFAKRIQFMGSRESESTERFLGKMDRQIWSPGQKTIQAFYDRISEEHTSGEEYKK